jgi:hypothetical protein
MSLYKILTEEQEVLTHDTADVIPEQPDPDNQSPGVDENGNPLPTPAELKAQQIDQVDNLFLKTLMMERCSEVGKKIENLLLSLKQDSNEDLKHSLNQYLIYTKTLNSVITSLEPNAVYQMLGQIELEVIHIMKNYMLQGANYKPLEDDPVFKDSDDEVGTTSDETQQQEEPTEEDVTEE